MGMQDAEKAANTQRPGATDDAPEVSVVIAAYNCEAYLGRTIEAVRAQTVDDWEVIVVDDCSPDDISQALAPFRQDRRIRLVRHAQNQGAAAARNTGIAEARGRFVAFLDADDDWMPTKLERQLAAMSDRPDPDRVFCVTSTIVRLDGDRHLVRPKRPKDPNERLDEFIFVSAGFCQTSSFLVSTELARKVGWRALPIGEDHMFAIDVLEAGAEYLLIDEPLVVYDDAIRPGRLSATASLENGRIFMDAVRGTLSHKAMLGYHSRYLGSTLLRSRPVQGISVIASALRHGAISPRFAASLLVRTLVPGTMYQRIRARLLGSSNSSAA